jgi:hypothetical protein
VVSGVDTRRREAAERGEEGGGRCGCGRGLAGRGPFDEAGGRSSSAWGEGERRSHTVRRGLSRSEVVAYSATRLARG